MAPLITPETEEQQITGQSSDWLLPRKVVVHNCDCHTFEQVILALVKTLDMSVDAAYEFATLVHLTGAAVVFEGELEKCELIADNIVAWAGISPRTGLPLKVTVEE